MLAMTGAPQSTKSGTVSDAERGSQHGAVLRRVLEAGARVDAKDAAGWTALHHALGAWVGGRMGGRMKLFSQRGASCSSGQPCRREPASVLANVRVAG